MPETITRPGALYSRAPALGLSDGQAHALAEVLVRAPGTTLEFDGAVLTVTPPGRPGEVVWLTAVEDRMPFEHAGIAYRDRE